MKLKKHKRRGGKSNTDVKCSRVKKIEEIFRWRNVEKSKKILPFYKEGCLI